MVAQAQTALADLGRGSAGRHAHAGNRRRQHHHRPQQCDDAGQLQPVGDRRASGNAGRQPAAHPDLAAALRPHRSSRPPTGARRRWSQRRKPPTRTRGATQMPTFLTPGARAISLAPSRCSTATEGGGDGRQDARADRRHCLRRPGDHRGAVGLRRGRTARPPAPCRPLPYRWPPPIRWRANSALPADWAKPERATQPAWPPGPRIAAASSIQPMARCRCRVRAQRSGRPHPPKRRAEP